MDAVEEEPWGCGQAVEAWSGGAVGEIWRRDAVDYGSGSKIANSNEGQ